MKIKVTSQKRIDVEKDCKEWAKEIASSFQPDLIVFIANSGFLFGKAISDELNVPLAYVRASRSGNQVKDRLSGVKKMIPEVIVKKLISSPIKYYIHSKRQERQIELSPSISKKIHEMGNKILIVDDAVDTGWTVKKVYEEIACQFPEATIKTAAYSVSEFSKKVTSIDYYRFWNELILTATSRKSDEYENYIRDLELWLKSEGRC